MLMDTESDQCLSLFARFLGIMHGILMRHTAVSGLMSVPAVTRYDYILN